jgi:ribosomal peptide maturation radical SAM protein 1
MRVLFVSMPFGAVRAAIGPSLLKAHLAAAGYHSRVWYLNMRFARQLGSTDYSYVAEGAPNQSLAGDWIFSSCLYGERPTADAAYFDAFEERFGRDVSCAGAIATIRRAGALADAFLDECLDDPIWQDYDTAGFTSTFTQHVASLALARRLKERYPDKTVIFGGANCESVMGLAVHRMFPFIDYVCSGEADVSFPRLVDALSHGGEPHAIPGVIARAGGQSVALSLSPERVANLDHLPVPDYDDFFEQLAAMGDSTAGILMESSRGCWWGEKHHCTFCGLNGTTMAYRSKSANRVLAEIETQVARYQRNSIEMVDNILDMHYFNDLLPQLRSRGLRLDLFYETKANLTKKQVQELYESGITSIQPGIESLSTSVLRIMRKGTTAMQNIQLLKWCKEIGIQVFWVLLYGFPGEDPADYRRMAVLIDQLTHLEPPRVLQAIRLDRFSPNFVSAKDLGLCNVRLDRSYRLIYDEDETNLSDLAYYFEYDYVDGRRPLDYVTETDQAVRRWFDQTGGQGLIYLDRGAELDVWDFRPVTRRRHNILTGVDRDVYLYCDSQRSARAVETFIEGLGLPAEAAQESVCRLVRDQLILQLDDRYLSLAIAATVPPDTELSLTADTPDVAKRDRS